MLQERRDLPRKPVSEMRRPSQNRICYQAGRVKQKYAWSILSSRSLMLDIFRALDWYRPSLGVSLKNSTSNLTPRTCTEHYPFQVKNDACTGCTLCFSVCPIIDCIKGRHGNAVQNARAIIFRDELILCNSWTLRRRDREVYFPHSCPTFSGYFCQKNNMNLTNPRPLQKSSNVLQIVTF